MAARLSWILAGWERAHKEQALLQVAGWVKTIGGDAQAAAARPWLARSASVR